MRFSPVDFPEGMPDFGDMPDISELPEMPPNGFKPEKFEMKLDDLPLESVFSQMLLLLNTILLFLIPVAGLLTLLDYRNIKKKLEKELDELLTDEIPDLDNLI